MADETPRILVAVGEGWEFDQIARMLSLRGMESVRADDGVEALAKATELVPAVVVLDTQVAGSMEFLERHSHSESLGIIPVVLLAHRNDLRLGALRLREGARMVFERPIAYHDMCAAVQAQALVGVSTVDPSARAKKLILLVEDDTDVRMAMGVRLKSLGYDVTVAKDGVSAVALTRRGRPDLVLLDLGLPCGDGFAVLDRLHRLPDAPPIIVISGRDRELSEQRVLGLGARAFLQKPVENDVLHDAIAEVLGRGSASGKARWWRRAA